MRLRHSILTSNTAIHFGLVMKETQNFSKYFLSNHTIFQLSCRKHQIQNCNKTCNKCRYQGKVFLFEVNFLNYFLGENLGFPGPSVNDRNSQFATRASNSTLSLANMRRMSVWRYTFPDLLLLNLKWKNKILIHNMIANV